MDRSDIRQILVGRSKVGLVGLGEVFEQTRAEDFDSDEELAERLLERVRRSNYIPPGTDQAYKHALLREFRRFMGEDVSEERSGLEIRVFGAGCPRCDRVMADVMALLADMGLSADLEHVKDLERIGGLGLVATPALMINGKIVSAGRIPSRKELTGWLKTG